MSQPTIRGGMASIIYFGLPHSNDMNPTPAAPKGATARLDQDPKWWAAPLYRNEELIEQPADQTTLTRRYTEQAVKFIGDHKNIPFFLYLAHTFPHVPLFASGKFNGESRRGLYGDVVEEIDWSVGEVLESLRRQGLNKNTLVFYYRGARLFAARKGPYKAHFITQSAYGPDKPVRHDPPLLFHLGHDPSERFNVATDHADVLADIAQEVQRHRATVIPVKSQLEETIKPN